MNRVLIKISNRRIIIKFNQESIKLNDLKDLFNAELENDILLKDQINCGHVLFKKFDPLFGEAIEIKSEDIIRNGEILEATVMQIFNNIEEFNFSNNSELNFSDEKEASNPYIEEPHKAGSEFSRVSFPAPLPQFSDIIREAIAKNRLMDYYLKFIQECAGSLLRMTERPTKQDYKNFSCSIGLSFPYLKDKDGSMVSAKIILSQV